MVHKNVKRMLRARGFRYEVIFKNHAYANQCFTNFREAKRYKIWYSKVLKSNGYNVKGRIINL